ncbi:hypothetical protein PSTG_20212, partial [Puccinia striiformis f. sp. tritici PST-78]
TLAEISNLSLKIDNELNGTEAQATQSTSTTPTADPNAMDLPHRARMPGEEQQGKEEGCADIGIRGGK